MSYEADIQTENRVLRHQLATANGERYRLQALVNELTTALAEWGNTYPDLGDAHDMHRRGYFNGDCAGCVAESKLLTIAQTLADEMDRMTVQPQPGTDPAGERASSSSVATAVHGHSVASSVTP